MMNFSVRKPLRKSVIKKSGICVLLAAVFLLLSFTNALAAPSGISVFIDGEPLVTDVAPIETNGRTLVPMRAIGEALGAQVDYFDADRSITVTRGNLVIRLVIDSTTVSVNGVVSELDVPATVVDGRTLVPLRFVGESLRATVEWVNETRYVLITSFKEIPNVPVLNGMQDELLTLINEARERLSLQPLVVLPSLQNMAERHCKDMTGNKFFSLVSPIFGNGEKRAYDLGIGAVSENIACGYPDAQSLFDALMGSSEHRENILSANACFAGVAICQEVGGSVDDIYACVTLSRQGFFEQARSEKLSGRTLVLAGYVYNTDTPIQIFQLDPQNESRYISRKTVYVSPGVNYKFEISVELWAEGVYQVVFEADQLRIDNR